MYACTSSIRTIPEKQLSEYHVSDDKYTHAVFLEAALGYSESLISSVLPTIIEDLLLLLLGICFDLIIENILSACIKIYYR